MKKARKSHAKPIRNLEEEGNAARRDLVRLLRAESRDYAEMRRLLRRYIEFQRAVDALNDRSDGSPAPTPTASPRSPRPQETDEAAGDQTDDRSKRPAAGAEEETVGVKGAAGAEEETVGLEDALPSPPVRLFIHAKDGKETVVDLAGGQRRYVIGRESESGGRGLDVALADRRVSHRHFELTWDADQGWTIEDLDTTNGTFLDGMPVVRPTPLPESAEIRAGETTIRLRLNLSP